MFDDAPSCSRSVAARFELAWTLPDPPILEPRPRPSRANIKLNSTRDRNFPPQHSLWETITRGEGSRCVSSCGVSEEEEDSVLREGGRTASPWLLWAAGGGSGGSDGGGEGDGDGGGGIYQRGMYRCTCVCVRACLYAHVCSTWSSSAVGQCLSQAVQRYFLSLCLFLAWQTGRLAAWLYGSIAEVLSSLSSLGRLPSPLASADRRAAVQRREEALTCLLAAHRFPKKRPAALQSHQPSSSLPHATELGTDPEACYRQDPQSSPQS